MRRMRNRSWNKAALAATLSVLAVICVAQTQPVKPVVPAQPVASAGADALADALACRISYQRYPGLMQEIRAEREDDFRQAYRQYNKPMMDFYRLEAPVQAWGNESDAILIEPNRVMMAVEGTLDEVTAKLEHALEQSSESPLSGALDDQHALLIFEAEQPGLEGMVLLGCEYRIPDVSLLDDPADAWRKKQAGDEPLLSQPLTIPSNP